MPLDCRPDGDDPGRCDLDDLLAAVTIVSDDPCRGMPFILIGINVATGRRR
jgi:hypothetical protein